MPVGAILGVGAVASSVLGARSASRAAGAQEDASEAAIEEQRRQFNQTREDLAPARHAGRNALSMMQGLNGIGEMPAFNRNGRELGLGQDDDGWFLNRRDGSDWRRTNVDFDNRAQADRFIDSRRAGFEESPGYQYRVEEGQKALERMASARGIRMGGATMTEAIAYKANSVCCNFRFFCVLWRAGESLWVSPLLDLKTLEPLDLAADAVEHNRRLATLLERLDFLRR